MTGRIVVGIDGSEESQAALVWALRQARLQGAVLDVVYAWHPLYIADISGMAMSTIRPEEMEASAQAVLDHSVAELGNTADVEVNPILATGSAAHVLLETAKGADLLVVGSRGRGGFSGLLLGSTSQQCAHHATCPVVIVRAKD